MKQGNVVSVVTGAAAGLVSSWEWAWRRGGQGGRRGFRPRLAPPTQWPRPLSRGSIIPEALPLIEVRLLLNVEPGFRGAGSVGLRSRTTSMMLGPVSNALLFTFYFSGRAGNVASLHSMTLPSATSSVSRFVVPLEPF